MINTCFHGNCSVNHWGLCLSSQLFTSNRIIDGAIKEGDWRNIIKHDGALNSFTKAKGGKVLYDAKVVQSSSKAYLNPVVGQVKYRWDYIKRAGPSRKS